MIKHITKSDIDEPAEVINSAVLSEMPLYIDACSNLSENLSDGQKVYVSEIRESIATGVSINPNQLKKDRTYVNPTLIRPEFEEWHVHYDSMAFRCFLPMEKRVLDGFNSVYEACIDALQRVLQMYNDSLNRLNVKASIVMWVDDAFSFLHHQLQPDAAYDFIHTSNLPDHLGLLNLLVSCAPRLRNHSSVLITETFRWSVHFKTLQEYVEANVGCNPILLPLVLGIHLAEDFDLGTTKMQNLTILKSVKLETLHWMKNHGNFNVLSSLTLIGSWKKTYVNGKGGGEMTRRLKLP